MLLATATAAGPTAEIRYRVFGIWCALTPDGDTDILDMWGYDTLYYRRKQANSVMLERVVYWQPVPCKKNKFLFVSHTWFKTISGGRMIKYESAPTDIIDEDLFGDRTKDAFWIWINGKQVLFRTKHWCYQMILSGNHCMWIIPKS